MCHGQKVKCMNKFFVTSFWVSFILLILSWIISTMLFGVHYALVEKLYGISSDVYTKVYIMLFGIWKILIIQFTLIPAIVTWLISRHMKEEDSGEG